MNAFQGGVERRAMQAYDTYSRDGHAAFLKFSPETRIGTKKLLDKAIDVSSTDRQQLLLSLIGGEGTPGAQPAALAWHRQTFEIDLPGFTKQEVAQEFLDGRQIDVELDPFQGLWHCTLHSLAPVSGVGRYGGRSPETEMPQR